MGITRGTDIEGVDGFEAVRLSGGNTGEAMKKALKTLISYNNADIINLEPLMELAYEKMRDQGFFIPMETIRII